MYQNIDAYTLRVASILRREYERCGISYRVLAERTGLSMPTVERVINGKRPISTFYLQLLCAEFGTTPAAVLNEASTESK
jgi:transcriptional regulator with XRE-family HTH domain